MEALLFGFRTSIPSRNPCFRLFLQTMKIRIMIFGHISYLRTFVRKFACRKLGREEPSSPPLLAPRSGAGALAAKARLVGGLLGFARPYKKESGPWKAVRRA